MTTVHNSGQHNAVEGLPKQFVTSLRVLFDILDEDRTGYVRLRDIESRWHEEGVQGLPSGVIDALRKVAPRNGRLSFDNFVTGLKLSLLKTHGSVGLPVSSHHKPHGRESAPTLSSAVANKPKEPQPKPVKKLDNGSSNYANMANYMNIERPATTVSHKSSYTVQRSQPKMGSQMVTANTAITNPVNTATVRPNNVLQSQNIELRNQIYNRDQLQQASAKLQSKSDYQYQPELERNVQNRSQGHSQKHSDDMTHYRKIEQSRTSRAKSQRPKSAQMESIRNRVDTRPSDFPQGRPERPPPYRKPGDRDNQPPALPPKNMQGRIMKELKNWQKEHKIGQHPQGGRPLHTTHSDSKLIEKSRLSGNDLYVNIEEIRKHEANQKTAGGKKQIRRQNSRRHTLSSGIDYNVIRRMKQLEGEKDVLLQGMEVVERAREWYLTQIAMVTDKQNYAEKTSCSDVTLEAHQERMDFVRSRINDVSLNLKSLMETTESGFPAHMNLAIRSSAFSEDKATRWLKDQNKQLTKEVGEKCDKITQLEKEKASLIRDLFDARSKHKTNYDDTTFM